METIRPAGFNEPAPFGGYYVERAGETTKHRLYRRVDGKRFYLLNLLTGKAREVTRQAATIIGLRMDLSITDAEYRLLARIFGVRVGKGAL